MWCILLWWEPHSFSSLDHWIILAWPYFQKIMQMAGHKIESTICSKYDWMIEAQAKKMKLLPCRLSHSVPSFVLSKIVNYHEDVEEGSSKHCSFVDLLWGQNEFMTLVYRDTIASFRLLRTVPGGNLVYQRSLHHTHVHLIAFQSIPLFYDST